MQVYLQSFAEAHREAFWNALHRYGLHPLPLSEAFEIYLNETQIQGVAEYFTAFDIMGPKGVANKPFLVIELDIGAFDGETKYERLQNAKTKLGSVMGLAGHMNELKGEDLFAGMQLDRRFLYKAHSDAWLTDALFWPTDIQEQRLADRHFQRPLKKAA